MPFYNYLDTSAVLTTGVLASCQHCYISNLVLREMENIKTSKNKDDEVKAAARAATREIIKNPLIVSTPQPRDKIEKIFKKNSILPDTNDSRIICEALYLVKLGHRVNFITTDKAQYCLARTFSELEVKLLDKDSMSQSTDSEVWEGWKKYCPSEKDMACLYSNPEINTLNAKINEYCVICEGDETKDILRWDGNQYRKLKYKNMKNPFTGEEIKPRNMEQKMAFDLLQNQTIKVKTLYSSWGGGKTLLALTYALEQIDRGYYQKIVFVRNNIIAKNTNDIGYLPSDLRSKMSIWNRNVADHVGGDLTMEQMEEDGIIETFPLSHMRGRSLRNTICIVDECENLTAEHITLLMSRIEENSEIIFCGDGSQCDLSSKQMMGMYKMINSLAGDKLFGVVKLIRSERGPVPRLCDKIIPPR